MARRNGGVFEPEFRLFMVGLVALSTVLGLWGFGWSAQVQDPWIAPTVFFGVIGTDSSLYRFVSCLGLGKLILLGFGCTLGSTVSISFVVDSYRADAGSSLTSLNFSKNLLGTAHLKPQMSPFPFPSQGFVLLLFANHRLHFLVSNEQCN